VFQTQVDIAAIVRILCVFFEMGVQAESTVWYQVSNVKWVCFLWG